MSPIYKTKKKKHKQLKYSEVYEKIKGSDPYFSKSINFYEEME
jgi:hypothetical protein